MKIQYFLGVNEDSELYSIEIEPMNGKHAYFSICGQTDRPIEYQEAVNRTREQLEDGELWRMAVADGKTEMSLADWVEYVIDVDGEVSGIDNSCLPDEYKDENGIVWLLEGLSGGQHQERTLEHSFIPQELLDEVMETWDGYHLKSENPKNLSDLLARLDKACPSKEEALKRAVDLFNA